MIGTRHSRLTEATMMDWLRTLDQQGVARLPEPAEIMERYGFDNTELARTLIAQLADGGIIRVNRRSGYAEFAILPPRPARCAIATVSRDVGGDVDDDEDVPDLPLSRREARQVDAGLAQIRDAITKPRDTQGASVDRGAWGCGHPRDAENSRNKGSGRYGCKSCHSENIDRKRERNRRYYETHKEQESARSIAKSKALVAKIKSYLAAYLASHPCVDCGEADITVLDFDHRVPAEKLFRLSDARRGKYRPALVEQEVAKCDVRCSNCHRRRTLRQISLGEIDRRPRVLRETPGASSSGDATRIIDRAPPMPERHEVETAGLATKGPADALSPPVGHPSRTDAGEPPAQVAEAHEQAREPASQSVEARHTDGPPYRMPRKAKAAQKFKCGHSRTPENSYTNGGKKRRCATCKKAVSLKQAQAVAAERKPKLERDPALLCEIEQFLVHNRMGATTFGKLALNRLQVVGQLRSGAKLMPETAGRIRAFMAGYVAPVRDPGGRNLRAVVSADPVVPILDTVKPHIRKEVLRAWREDGRPADQFLTDLIDLGLEQYQAFRRAA